MGGRPLSFGAAVTGTVATTRGGAGATTLTWLFVTDVGGMTCGTSVVDVLLVVVAAESRSGRFGMKGSRISAVPAADKATTVPAGFTFLALEPPKPCEASRDIPALTITMSTTRSLRGKSLSLVDL
jgi:hypothetical protein